MTNHKFTEEESTDKTEVDEQVNQALDAEQADDVVEGTVEEEAETVDAALVEEVEEEEPLRLQLLRLHADFDNFRKRVARERTALYTRANQDLIEELLPVMDHYEMGLENAAKNEAEKSVIDGFQMVYDQMQKVLEKYNVTALDSLGKAFDPHTQEAISHLPSADIEENIVMAQVRRGYLIGEKLLRAAQVVVSSGSPSA